MSFLICNAIFLFNRVDIGSLEHMLPILITSILATIFILFSKNNFSKYKQERSLLLCSIIVSLTVFCFHIWQIYSGSYNLNKDLPLYLCSLMALFIPVFGYYRKLWMYEILLFWIITGTVQGVITPDISLGFPSFDYFRYWIVHLGLLVIIFYATFVLKMKPKLKSVFKSFFALQAYVISIMVINYMLSSNYGYLNEKPESASILDYLGEWPFYIITVQLLLVPCFLLIYLPFYIIEVKRKKRF